MANRAQIRPDDGRAASGIPRARWFAQVLDELAATPGHELSDDRVRRLSLRIRVVLGSLFAVSFPLFPGLVLEERLLLSGAALSYVLVAVALDALARRVPGPLAWSAWWTRSSSSRSSRWRSSSCPEP
ncbi:MAG: hypothetical protein M5U14_16810 [Acidimicrobiia bacterium]|nr:hypothetical protein [Acidimicrobiia bacterium]